MVLARGAYPVIGTNLQGMGLGPRPTCPTTTRHAPAGVNRIHEGSEVAVANLADERTLSGIQAFLPVAAEAHFTFILHNLQLVLDLPADGVAEAVLRALVSLPGGEI